MAYREEQEEREEREEHEEHELSEASVIRPTETFCDYTRFLNVDVLRQPPREADVPAEIEGNGPAFAVPD